MIDDEPMGDDLHRYRPGPLTILITLLLVLAMLATLLWPLLRPGPRYQPVPTPTRGLLQEA